jgi:aspartate ammonia-lyase
MTPMTPGDNGAMRIERDPLGERRVPAGALYGVQTSRALEHFRISRQRIHPLFTTAYAEIKKAAALANMETSELDREVGDAIVRAAEEIIAGQHREHFDLDVFQAGAGTSYNMNVNEVIANRALELMGHARGDYARINPNDHVNKSQSTNDTMPTAMRVTTVRLLRELIEALETLAGSFEAKGEEFSDVWKSGRTHLHDATPITLGDEMAAYAFNLRRATERLRAAEDPLLEVPLGGTALGNSVNAEPDYAPTVVETLGEITELELREPPNRIALTQSLGDFVAVSAMLRALAIELGKIANDLRLLNSGPHTGFNEIELPAMQPGSSIMPGKVNPAVAEMVNMVCFHVVGLDAAISMASEAGQLELNVMMPYVAYALFEALDVLTNAVRTFDEKCARILVAHEDKCREHLERSVGLAALYNGDLGFMGAAELAEKAVETGKSIGELVEEGEAPGADPEKVQLGA